MPRNTIQIRLKRMMTSVHSAGCSSTKRVMIWNTPRAEASTIMAQAAAIEAPLAARSSRRKAAFNLLDVADGVEVGLAELLFEVGVDRRQGLHEAGLVDVVDHGHALGAQVGHAL